MAKTKLATEGCPAEFQGHGGAPFLACCVCLHLFLMKHRRKAHAPGAAGADGL